VPPARERRRYVDWARGLAVLVMIEAHTFDAWTRPTSRVGHAFRNLTVLGGFAAPLFLWLAGVALVLSAERTAERTGSRHTAAATVCRRGLEIFILAFLFRLQAFIVSPGSALVMLFRVDILNIMGPAIVVAGLVWGFTTGVWTTIALTVLATSVALVTPIVRGAAWVNVLPLWGQWYVRPQADYTLFTVFPWVGFLFAGAAVGVLLAAARNARDEGRLQLALGGVGALLVAGGFYAASLPSVYHPRSSFWYTSPTFFAIRLGVMMLALTLLFGLQRGIGRWVRDAAPSLAIVAPLERIGRSSLFIYWIHVELVYGYATWPLRRHLSLWQVAVAYVLFCAAMYGALLLRDRVVAGWRLRRLSGTTAEPVAAQMG
jgi:uncharacterized membrane protein